MSLHVKSVRRPQVVSMTSWPRESETAVIDDQDSALQCIIRRFAPDWAPVLDVPSGWDQLLIELDRTLTLLAPDYVVQQVKSKFGSLRFHALPSVDPYDYNEEFQEAIRAAEWRSIETCEECGAPAQQYAIRMWVSTLCKRHRDQLMKLDPDQC